jgi:hypothetical protein
MGATRYSNITLRTPDRLNYYLFKDDVYITGIEGLYDMPERNKSIYTVFGRDGGFEVYGGLMPKTLTMSVEIIVSTHEDIYAIMQEIHLLLSYQSLELYFDPPKRYVKVSYKKDSLTEQLGYAGTYIRGTIEFDIIDPFWYSQVPKMLVAGVDKTGIDGTVDGGNYFFSQDYVENYSGFNSNDIGKILYIQSGLNEGYYEIVDTQTSGCIFSSEISVSGNQSNISYTLYNQPKISRSLIGNFTYSGQGGTNAYAIITDDYIKTYTDYFKVCSYFNGTMTIDSDKIMFTSGLSEIQFLYQDYSTIENLVSGINEYSVSGDINLLNADYLHGNSFNSAYTRNTWHPSGLYGIAYEPIYSGIYRNVLLQDKVFTASQFVTLGDISGYIKGLNDGGDFTYKISGFVSNYTQYATRALTDKTDQLVHQSGCSLYANDFLEYTKAGGNIPIAGNYKIYPRIQVINRGLIDLDGFDIIHYSSGSLEEGRISYFGTLESDHLLEIDTLEKTVKEYDISTGIKDNYANNIYINRINKTTTITDFVYLENDDYTKWTINTDSENLVDIDFLVKWTDRYI